MKELVKDPLRIAILGPYFWPQLYGIEKVMYAHAKHLALLGHDVHVITSRMRFPTGIDASLPTFEMHDAFTIRRIPVLLRDAGPFHYPSRGGVLLDGLQRSLKGFQPEIIHAHNIGAPAWALGGALYARSHRAAFFYSPHHHPNNLKFGLARKVVLRGMNYIPIRSAAKVYHLTTRDFETFPLDYGYADAERFAVLLNGVDPPKVQSKRASTEQLKMLFVGRVDDPRKGFSILESAIDDLPESVRKRFHLQVVGSVSAPTRARLESKYAGTITVDGSVSEEALERAYAGADIFIMPSLYEGFGMPYIEAMRYGVPVIGSNAGGVPEVVPPDTGLLTPPGDVASVARAITQLVTMPDVRLRLGAAGELWSRRYHWKAIVEGLERDYREAAAK